MHKFGIYGKFLSLLPSLIIRDMYLLKDCLLDLRECFNPFLIILQMFDTTGLL